MRTREALLPDAQEIHDLIALYSEKGALLPRLLPELCENIRDFMVVESEGRIAACGALHIYGLHLAEVRSIAVRPTFQGRGAGRLLVQALLAQAEKHRISGVCLFTRIPEFFAKLGFSVAAREDLPDKIYKDCLQCPKLLECDEVAMLRGRVPAGTALARPLVWPLKLRA